MPGMRQTGAIVALFGVATIAPAPGAPVAQTPDKVVRVQTLNVRDILYILTGGGGNALALMRDDGVVLIDTKLPGWGTPLLQAIHAVSDAPVSLIINTHAHPDHSGSNAEVSAARVVAHANTKARMATQPAAGRTAPAVPVTTVTDRLSLLDGADRIDLYYFGRGHTDGDLIVVFPEKRLAHMGDLFPGKEVPRVDATSGGSAVELPRTLARAVAEIKDVARVTTGHDESSLVPQDPTSGAAIFANPRTMSWKDFEEYADFTRDFLAAVDRAIAAGRNAADASRTLQLPDRYKGYDLRHAPAYVEAIYGERGR
jgi:glyoxylase-like metal-dependent hydrolase (beta-lactamase superfamily II)